MKRKYCLLLLLLLCAQGPAVSGAELLTGVCASAPICL